jgi:hypothetical protein
LAFSQSGLKVICKNRMAGKELFFLSLLPKARAVSGSSPTRIMTAAYRMAASLLPRGPLRTHRKVYGVCTWSSGRGSLCV